MRGVLQACTVVVLDTVTVTALCSLVCLLPGPDPRGSSSLAEARQRGERGGKEAAFPATESTRTSRDLAPDASFAAQASGFFHVPANGRLENEASRPVNTGHALRATCRDDALLTIRIMRIFVTHAKRGREGKLTDEYQPGGAPLPRCVYRRKRP